MRRVFTLISVALVSSGFASEWDSEVVRPKELLALSGKVPEGLKSSVIVLQDRGAYLYKRKGHTYTVTQYAVKVLADAAIEQGIADCSFAYNSYYQKLVHASAETILADGKIVRLGAKDFHDDPSDGSDAVYSSERTVKFSFPAVETGVVLNYVFVTEEVKEVMPGQYSGTWVFWTGAPVMESALILEYPSDCPMRVRHVNHTGKEASTEIGGRLRKEWHVTRMDASEREPFMPRPDTLFPQTEFTTTKSWNEIATWYDGVTEPLAKLDPDIVAALDLAVAGKKTDREKAEAVWSWVTGNIRYVSVSLGQSSHRPHSPTEVFTKRYGDCKDQSLFLVAALRKYGIKANLALLCAGDAECFQTELPTVNRFDHCIAVAEVEGKRYWMDATDGQTPFGFISEAELGVPVLIVKRAGSEIVTLPKYDGFSPREQNLCLKVDLQPDASGEVTMETRLFGALAKHVSEANQPSDRDELDDAFKSSLKKMFPSVKDVKVSYEAPDKEDAPLTITATGHAGRAGELLGDMLLVNSITSSWEQEDEENLLGTNGKRDHPFQFGDDGKQVVTFQIRLPQGWEVGECFKPFELSGPGKSMKRTVTRNGDLLTVQIVVDHRDEILPASDIQKVIEFRRTLAQTREGRLVLRRVAAKK